MEKLALTIPGGQSIQAPPGLPQGGIDVVSKASGNALTILIIIAVILALIYLILGGIQWITSGGDKAKVQASRTKLTYAIVGLLVAMGAFFIVSIVGTFFNVKLF